MSPVRNYYRQCVSVTVYVNVMMSNKVVINELTRKSGGYLNSYLTKIYFLLIK